jgi:hypothetical protein
MQQSRGVSGGVFLDYTVPRPREESIAEAQTRRLKLLSVGRAAHLPINRRRPLGLGAVDSLGPGRLQRLCRQRTRVDKICGPVDESAHLLDLWGFA